MKLPVILIAAAGILVSMSLGDAQERQFEQEKQQRAYSPSQTHGPPVSYWLHDVTVHLSRKNRQPMSQERTKSIDVKLDGSAGTVTLRRIKKTIWGKEDFQEGTAPIPEEEFFSLIEEAYQTGFFTLGADYTRRVYVKKNASGMITTHYGEPSWRYPTLRLSVRIGDYEKVVEAIDREHSAKYRGAPEGLLELSRTIQDSPTIRRLFDQIEE